MDGNRSTFAVLRSSFAVRRATFVVLMLALTFARAASPQTPAPSPLRDLTAPVNDFAKVIDADSAREMDRMIRTLQTATGDVVIVETVPTIEPYGDIREYAVKQFANNGKGIGQKGKNNGLLIVLALKERRLWIEVGYDLEQYVTDGFAGETSRSMTPAFQRGSYGEGLRGGVERIIGRIAQGRGVTLEGVRVPQRVRQRGNAISGWLPIVIFIVILIISRLGGGGGRRSGFWSSGIGPFGGGFGGGFGGFGGGGGGGFGGGFGGFGGGSSGGGGGGSSW